MDGSQVTGVRVHVTITGRETVQVLNESYDSQEAAMYGIAEAFDMDTTFLGDPVEVGDHLRGFCGGYFGRDAMLDKEVVGIGPDWCVVQEPDGRIFAATGSDHKMPYTLAEYRFDPIMSEEYDDDFE